MNILPFRRADVISTDAMADTEAASSIPPWPVDFGPKPSAVEQPRPHLDSSAEMLGLLAVYVCCVITVVGVVAAVVW